MTITLRPYQERAIDEVRGALRSNKRVILKAATGSGKTEMAMFVINSAVAKGKRVAFVVNRVHLVEQTSRRFSRAGIRHGIIQSSNTRNPNEPVVVCSIATVARRGLPSVDLIVIDEAHAVAGSSDYRSILFSHNNLPVIGLTATPYSRGLGKHYDELGGPLFEGMVQAASIAELIDVGALVDCDIYAPSEPDLTGVRTQRNQFGEIDYSEADLGAAVDKPDLIGAIVEHWKRLANGVPTICFATNIKHSQHIVEEFVAAGIPACHIDCYMRPEERERLTEDFKAGEYKVLCNVALLAEGFDHPETGCMILARPTKSLIRFIQMGGRILRPADGKDRGLILDHSGSTARLGFPTEDRDIPLCDGRPRQSAPQKKEDALPKKCPSCSAMKPPKVHVCPKCGFAPERPGPVVDGSGSLQKLDRKKFSVEMKQSVYSQLLGYAKERGYKGGWVDHAYRDYFGVWPRGMHDVAMPAGGMVLGWLTYRNIRRAKGKQKSEQMGVSNALC